MTTDVTLTPSAIVAGAIERYCDNLGEPMPSPALARALGTVAVEVIAQLAEQHGAIGSKCPKGIAPNPSAECGCRACRPRFPFAALLRKDPHASA